MEISKAVSIIDDENCYCEDWENATCDECASQERGCILGLAYKTVVDFARQFSQGQYKDAYKDGYAEGYNDGKADMIKAIERMCER